MKYKIVAILNLFFGGMQTLSSLGMFFSVLPKLSDLYNEFGVNFSKTQFYLLPLVYLLIGVGNVFFGIRLIKSTDKNRDTYFLTSVTYLIVTYLLVRLTPQLSPLTITAPIYNLNSSL